ncbi:MAG: hypothetical protein SAK29_14295 [Scytonema sp. PMC 1069.18]|nr:hypothetical protein [Scytonema sp. PMC 1069.18]MEC4881539.1 hypothetical protein [Scytonema sp. PMC 1070.18]
MHDTSILVNPDINGICRSGIDINRPVAGSLRPGMSRLTFALLSRQPTIRFPISALQ